MAYVVAMGNTAAVVDLYAQYVPSVCAIRVPHVGDPSAARSVILVYDTCAGAAVARCLGSPLEVASLLASRPLCIAPLDRGVSCVNDGQHRRVRLYAFAPVGDRRRGSGMGVPLLRHPRPGVRRALRRVRQVVLQLLRQRLGQPHHPASRTLKEQSGATLYTR